MHDKNITNETIEQSQAASEDNPEETTTPEAVTATHCFYQLSGDLLSKPNALCDIIELEGRPATLIFCNLPSDTDMVEAVLNRRGIKATKIIGNVPQPRVVKAVKSARDGEITAIVVTDIGARHLEVEDLDLIINYSIPDDPEIYLHRIGNSGAGGQLHKIISFVNPLDISNFHYLKKLVGFPFAEMSLPGPEEMQAAKIKSLRVRADSGPHLAVEHLCSLAGQLAKEADDRNFLSLLLYNTFELLPKLQADAGSGNQDSGFDDSRSERYERGNYRQQRDRDNRGYSRGGGRHGGRESSGRYDSRQASDDDFGSERNPRSDRYSRRQNPVATVRETRLYLGLGSRDGFSEELFKEMLTEKCPEVVEKLRRFSLRNCYAFADFPEEVSKSTIEKLRDAKLGDGSRLVTINAATISSPVEDSDGSADAQDQAGDIIESEDAEQGMAANADNDEDLEKQE